MYSSQASSQGTISSEPTQVSTQSSTTEDNTNCSNVELLFDDDMDSAMLEQYMAS